MTLWMREEAKAAPPGGYGAGYGGGSWFSDAFRSRRAPSPSELVDAYKSLVYACVNLNANAVARTPLRLYATTAKGQHRPKCPVKAVGRATRHRLKGLSYKAMANVEDVEEVTEHPLLDLIMRPNDRTGNIQLIRYTVMSLDIVGDAYWWPSIGRLKQPEELWPLPPHLVTPVFDGGRLLPDRYTFGARDYRPEDLVVFKHESMSNLYGRGYSPTQAAIAYVRLEDTFVSIQADMLSNGPRPSVVVSHKDPKGSFGQAERTRLEADMNRKGRGGSAGGAFVVDGAVAVTPISYSPTDLGTKELSLYDMERTANCFGVPVSMLKTEDVNRANAEAGLEQHGRDAVEPRCKAIASELTRWTHSLDARGARGWDRLLWAFDPVVKDDKAAEAELHKTYFAMGLPANVILTEAGYDAVEGGDVSLVASGMVTLDSLINPPEPVAQPGGFGGDGTAAEIDPEEVDPSDDELPDDEDPADAPSDKALRLRAKVLAERLRKAGVL
jgi:HK97 family phage portal protein